MMKPAHVSQVDRDLRDVIAAAELVRSGRADRAQVSGLRRARRVMLLARRRYAELPLRIRPIPRPNWSGVDIVIERVREEASA